MIILSVIGCSEGQDVTQKDIYTKTHNVLSQDESLLWLHQNGYSVTSGNDGFRITRKSANINIDISSNSAGGAVIHQGLPDGTGRKTAILINEWGNLYIAIPK